jgi:hypothetical protein
VTNETEVERMLKALTAEVGRLRNALGAQNKTLMFELDERYMPRGELEITYIQRREFEDRERREVEATAAWRHQRPLVFIAGGGWLLSVIEFLTTHHV